MQRRSFHNLFQFALSLRARTCPECPTRWVKPYEVDGTYSLTIVSNSSKSFSCLYTVYRYIYCMYVLICVYTYVTTQLCSDFSHPSWMAQPVITDTQPTVTGYWAGGHRECLRSAFRLFSQQLSFFLDSFSPSWSAQAVIIGSSSSPLHPYNQGSLR